MKIENGKKAILNGSKAFRDRHRTAYGQLIQKLDDEYYLMSDTNLKLSKLTENDIKLYTIGSDDISRILTSRLDINALAFICTEDAVRFSSKGVPMQPSLDDLAQIIGPDVPIIETVSSKNILKACQHRGGCLVKGAGIFGVGRNMPEAVAAAQIIAKGCEAEEIGGIIGGATYLPYELAAELHTDYLNTYSIANSDGFVNFIGYDEDEFNLRNELIEYGKKMCKDSLVSGCWGNLSVKANDKEMLISPSGMDYFDIKIEDIVKVDLETLSYGEQRKPSTESLLHAVMYKNLPNCNAIIHTHSNACSVFAAAKKGFAIEDPLLHELIGDLLVSEYAPSGSRDLAKNVISVLQKTHAAILPNHGAIFYGPSLDVVLAIANAVEAKAANLLAYNSAATDEDEESEVKTEVEEKK